MTKKLFKKELDKENLLHDLKERFLKFETVRGLYLLAAGLLGIWTTKNNLQFVIQCAAYAGFGYVAILGLEMIFANRIKQKLKFNKEVFKAEDRAIKSKKEIGTQFQHPAPQPLVDDGIAKTLPATDAEASARVEGVPNPVKSS
jgi:hypothetical protein